MRRPLLTLIALFVSFSSFSQIRFEPGYYIDLVGKRVDCLIRNADWKNSPSTFTYKLTETGETQQMNVTDLTEFKVGDNKFIAAEVQYDGASQDLKKIGVLSSPEWTKGRLILKVLVDGTAKLYQYATKELTLFFYKVNDSPIEQLVFKNYISPTDHTQLLSNRMYLAQLNTKVHCDKMTIVDNRAVSYDGSSLSKHFRTYNSCVGDIPEKRNSERKALVIALTPGVDLSQMTAERSSGRDYNFDNKTNFRMGLELEFTLPFKQGKWATIIEPTFQYFNSTDQNDFTIEYTSLEIPLGLRHKFFVGDKHYIFVDAMALLDFPIKHAHLARPNEVIKTYKGVEGFAGGIGYAFRKFSIEARYYPQRVRVDGSGDYEYRYKKTSVIIGFRPFK
jgi:hypothetical protein